jgi:uncharacterized glyoxalase superfamily protein PhnB
MAVKAIPDGYHSVTPELNVKGASKLIEFLKKAFDAEERVNMPGPGGTVMHAELRIGDSIVMLSDAVRQPARPSSIFLYVRDADAAYRRALEAGATSEMEPADMFWGDRMARVQDPCGNLWGIATHVEDVPPEEIARRAQSARPPGS